MPPRRIDPDRMAALEAAGWKAYYDRRWRTVFVLILQLSREQFGFSWPDALRGAYWIVRAAMAFAPRVGSDPVTACDYLTRYYRLARRNLGARFDPERVGGLEVAYWTVHRRLVHLPDHSALIDVLTDLHAALFGLSPETARQSAEHRARAARIVDRITNGHSNDVSADWQRIEQELRSAYRDLGLQLAA